MTRTTFLISLLALGLTACRIDTENEGLTGDRDGDGYSVSDGDCDDDNDAVNPGVLEVPYDGLDQDCDGVDLTDVDQDSFDAEVVGGTDCDDNHAGVYPGADDNWYDGVDSNCDGSDDFDQDHDGYVPDEYEGRTTEYVSTSGGLPGGDCDDVSEHINPGVEESWYDGVDANCDGQSDYDKDGDGYDSDLYDGPDCDDEDAEVNPGAEEVAGDDLDNDCYDDLPVIDSLELTPDEVYTDTVLMALAQASDPDGDPVEIIYTWYVDGVEDASTGTVLSSTSFGRGQAIYVTVTPTDGERNGSSVTSDLITVSNSPPVLGSVTLSTTSPTESDTLSVAIVASDADDDTLSYSYDWQVDGVSVGSSSTLSSLWFSKGEEVQVVVEASDGQDSSGTMVSDVATVLNTPPELDGALLEPDPVASTGTLTCTAGNATDIDGDSVSFGYTWTVSGSTAAASGSTLSAPHFSGGDIVQCTVTPNDGEDDGASVSTLTASVNNPPVVSSASIDPVPAYVLDTLECVHAAATDGDGDSVTLAYAWTNLDTGATLGSDAILAGAFEKGDELQCSVTPSDALEAGSTATSTVMISNTLPVVDSLELSSTEVYTDDLLEAYATSLDDDDDTVSLSYAWSVDGVVVGETGTSLDGVTWFEKGQTVQVEVTPNDGEDNGTTVASSVLTVLNTPPTDPVVAITPSHPTAGYDDMVCELSSASHDADGDSIDYTVSWTVDGVAYTGASTTTLTGDTVRGADFSDMELWECTVTASDDEGAGGSGSDSVYVGCDDDEDGHLAEVCGGSDCEDDDPHINPDAADTWYDGIDQDCDGWSDYDADGDGYDSDAYGGDDCDDADSTRNPGVMEIWYDGVDQDCSGGSDYDQDDDGHNSSSWGGLDCDDTLADISPDASEICDEGQDNDCDGTAELAVPSVYSAIQDAIDAAADGDLICVDTGTYYENIDFGGKRIHVKGVLGSSYTLIDGGGIETVASFVNEETEDAILEGFTLTNGYGDSSGWDGGGLTIGEYGSWSLVGASPTLIDLVITQNTGNYGGGAFVIGSPVFENVEFSDNTGYVGGVYAYGDASSIIPEPVFSSVDFIDNSSGFEEAAGAVYLDNGGAEFSDVVFQGNTGGFVGALNAGCQGLLPGVALTDTLFLENDGENVGGMYAYSCDATLENVSFIGNSGTYSYSYAGGAYLNQQSEYEVTAMENVLFADNSSSNTGGLWFEGHHVHSLDVSNAVFVGNTGDYGAGIRVGYSDLTLQNAVVVGNTASFYGGGVYYYGSNNATLTNVVISENTAGYAEGAGINASGSVALSYSNVWGNYPDDFYGMTDPTGTDGNTSVDPDFLDTSASDASDWDLHLATTSTLIDAGDPSLSDPDGSTSDIGAYGGTGAELWDLDGDGYPAWWQPGAYDSSTYPALGWDCDDSDAEVYPGSGC